MPTEIRYSPVFEKRYDHLVNKYPALETEFKQLVLAIKNDERPGDKVPGLGYDVHKVRLKNPSARKGKSGGFRVIYYIKLTNLVYMVILYSKSDESDVSTGVIRKIIKEILSSEDGKDDDE